MNCSDQVHDSVRHRFISNIDVGLNDEEELEIKGLDVDVEMSTASTPSPVSSDQLSVLQDCRLISRVMHAVVQNGRC